MTRRKPSPITSRDRAYFAERTIAALGPLDANDVEAWAPLIIAAFKGDADAFSIYDTELWRSTNFWAVRTIRNSPTYGPVLFSSFR